MTGLTYEFIARKGINEPDRFWSLPEHQPNVHTNVDNRLDAIENIRYYQGYAEPGYTDTSANPNFKGILLSDWNYFADRTKNLLEKAGYELEYNDEWSACDNCYRLVRTTGYSYGWQPYYVVMNDCELICKDCLLADRSLTEDYLQSLENKPETAVNLDEIDLEDYDYTRIAPNDGCDYQNGFHEGMNDNPVKIYNELSKRYHRLLFVITSTSQFYLEFAVYAKQPKQLG